MMIWVDAHLSPALADWIRKTFEVDAVALRDLGLRDATDRTIFLEARSNDSIIMTKDSDFVILLDRYGPPPRIIWLTCGNTSNSRLQQILSALLPQALLLLGGGERLVEINSIG